MVTGQARYRDYARTWEYTNYWNLFAEPGNDIFKPSPGYHAYSHVFAGTRVRWLGRKFDDAGQCEVSIDGKKVATVDQYDPTRDTPFRYEIRDLPSGQHTMRLTLLPHKNPASKNRYANITGFDVVCPLGGRATAALNRQ